MNIGRKAEMNYSLRTLRRSGHFQVGNVALFHLQGRVGVVMIDMADVGLV